MGVLQAETSTQITSYKTIKSYVIPGFQEGHKVLGLVYLNPMMCMMCDLSAGGLLSVYIRLNVITMSKCRSVHIEKIGLVFFYLWFLSRKFVC